MAIFFALIKTIRPRQWLKNLALYAALLFSGWLFDGTVFGRVTLAVIIFIMLSSATYIFNDLFDLEADRKHPFKKNRALASGALPIPIAVFVMITAVIVGLSWAYQLSYFLFLSTLAYLGLQILYTGYLKRIPIADVLVVASGYLIRVYAGAFVAEAHMDVWFLMTVISVSLFLAVGKRRSELTLLKAAGGQQVRETLKHYTEQLLDIYTSMFATATWLMYAIFTFNHPKIVPHGKALTILAELPKALVSEKWVMLTIPFVVYGVMRYLQLIYEKNEGESPERILLSDKPLMITVSVWVLLVIFLLYYVQ